MTTTQNTHPNVRLSAELALGEERAGIAIETFDTEIEARLWIEENFDRWYEENVGRNTTATVTLDVVGTKETVEIDGDHDLPPSVQVNGEDF